MNGTIEEHLDSTDRTESPWLPGLEIPQNTGRGLDGADATQVLPDLGLVRAGPIQYLEALDDVDVREDPRDQRAVEDGAVRGAAYVRAPSGRTARGRGTACGGYASGVPVSRVQAAQAEAVAFRVEPARVLDRGQQLRLDGKKPAVARFWQERQ